MYVPQPGFKQVLQHPVYVQTYLKEQRTPQPLLILSIMAYKYNNSDGLHEGRAQLST